MISAKEYKIKSVMLGHAVGDALGVPVEFYSREEIDEGPVTDMEGFGTYPFPAGLMTQACPLRSLTALQTAGWIMMKSCGTL